MSDQNTQNMQENAEEKLEAISLTQSSKALRLHSVMPIFREL